MLIVISQDNKPKLFFYPFINGWCIKGDSINATLVCSTILSETTSSVKWIGSSASVYGDKKVLFGFSPFSQLSILLIVEYHMWRWIFLAYFAQTWVSYLGRRISYIKINTFGVHLEISLCGRWWLFKVTQIKWDRVASLSHINKFK